MIIHLNASLFTPEGSRGYLSWTGKSGDTKIAIFEAFVSAFNVFYQKGKVELYIWKISTGWLDEFSRSLSHRNYTFCSKKILLGTSRHSRALGFQPCTPFFYIYLCTVGHQNFQDQKFQIGLLATQKQIKTYWMTKPHQNNHKKFWLAGFFNTS